MIQHAKGSFDVKVLPQTDAPEVAVGNIGRFALDKRYHGDLDAQSRGQMLGSRSNETTGGYVAIEQVDGTLSGHKGGFALQHIGTMQGGNAVMDVRVIPGSGTGELAGIDGTLKIIIADGKHTYDFSYTLP